LTDYIKLVHDDQKVINPELQHLAVGHVHDLMAVAVGTTRDAAETAEARGRARCESWTRSSRTSPEISTS
jgi:hypothetical protein